MLHLRLDFHKDVTAMTSYAGTNARARRCLARLTKSILFVYFPVNSSTCNFRQTHWPKWNIHQVIFVVGNVCWVSRIVTNSKYAFKVRIPWRRRRYAPSIILVNSERLDWKNFFFRKPMNSVELAVSHFTVSKSSISKPMVASGKEFRILIGCENNMSSFYSDARMAILCTFVFVTFCPCYIFLSSWYFALESLRPIFLFSRAPRDRFFKQTHFRESCYPLSNSTFCQFPPSF